MEADQTPVKKTKSVVRKALRDILRPVIPGTTVLDLFAGSGTVSRELLDEGASKAFAVDTRACPIPDDEIPDSFTWIREDVLSFLDWGPSEPVDLVFMDPPYNSDYPLEVLRILSEASWLTDQAILSAETNRRARLDENLPADVNLQLKRNRRYGNSRLWIFQLESGAAEEPGDGTN